MHRYKTWNGPMPTAAAQASVATGTVIKTMLQIATPATRQLQPISWGFEIDSNQGGTIELLQTDVGATITQAVASGIQPLDPNAPASLVDISSTTKTGYSASAEGAILSTRVFDVVQTIGGAIDTSHQYEYQWMPDERPIVGTGKFLRVRATFGTSTNLRCWVCWDE